jgi:hypothetical protein
MAFLCELCALCGSKTNHTKGGEYPERQINENWKF